MGFPGVSVGKESTCNTGNQRQCEDPSSVPGSGRSPGEEYGSPLQCSCLGNPMGRGAWQATFTVVPRVRHDLETKPPPPPRNGMRKWSQWNKQANKQTNKKTEKATYKRWRIWRESVLAWETKSFKEKGQQHFILQSSAGIFRGEKASDCFCWP